jgi:hypothetical protein
MRAIAAPVNEMAPRQQSFDLTRRKRIACFDGRLAGHHVEDFVQEFFLMHVKRFLFAAFKQFSEKINRV